MKKNSLRFVSLAPRRAARVYLAPAAAMLMTMTSARTALCEPSAAESDNGQTSEVPAPPPNELDGWAVEAAVGVIEAPGNKGEVMLQRTSGAREITPRVSISVVRRMIPHLSLVVSGATLAPDDYAAEWFDSSQTDAIRLRAQSLAAYVRLDTSLVPRHLSVFAQIGGGMGIGEISGPGAGRDAGIQTGALGGVSGGAVVAPWKNIAFVTQAGYESAQIFNFQGGKRPESGGISFVIGIRLQGSDT